jgi:excisionase family DNA binding protein
VSLSIGIQQQSALTLVQRLNQIERPITAKALADLLGVSHITVYKLAAKGVIPSFRIATAVRFDTRQVARWLVGSLAVTK